MVIMVRVESFMFNIVIAILSSFPFLFIASVSFTVAGINFVSKFVDNIKPDFWYKLAFGSLNGIIAIVAETFTTSNAPYIIMIFVPLVTVLEIMSISKNPLWIYVVILGAFILNVSVIYNNVVAVLEIGSFSSSQNLNSLDYRILFFSLTLVVSTLAQLLLTKVLPIREINFIVYRVDRSLMLVIYIYIVSITLLVVSFTSAPVIYVVSGEEVLLRIIYFEMILKDTVMLAGAYVILLFCCRDARNEFAIISLKKNLQWEKEFRTSTQTKAFCSYSYNATREWLEFEHPIFSSYSDNPCKENYYVLIQYYIDMLVHPEDKAKVLSELVEKDIKQKSQSKLLTSQFRLNRELLLKLLDNAESRELFKNTSREWVWVEARDTCITDIGSGDLIVYVDLFNVEDMVQEKEKLVSAATMDALTGLNNRASAEIRIQSFLSSKSKDGAFFIFDLDNFKQVNDTHGHPEGDRVLQEVARILKSIFRSEDVVARLGGDEFCVFAPGMVSMDAVYRCVVPLLERCHFEYDSPEGKFVVTMSIGVVLASSTDYKYSTLYKYADKALYSAKEAGKNQWKLYDELCTNSIC